MEPMLRVVKWSGVCVALVLLVGCQKPKPNPEAPIEPPCPDGASELCASKVVRRERIEQLVERGKKATDQLLVTLKRQLVAAIKSRGTIGAIEFCSTNALTLTRTVQTAWSEPIALKRTSLRVRNPKNAPDAFERTVLRWFIEQKKARGKLPSHYLQLVTGAKAPRVRYYRPLVVQAICLSCHGPRSSMPDALRKRIAALYPADRAFDYKLNDFRGLVRVELSLGEAERR